jgi:O-Antigen ligase
VNVLSRRANRWDAYQLAWLAPLAVAAFVLLASPSRLDTAVAALTGVAVVVLAARRADLGLLTLIAFLPFHAFFLSWIYALGVPISIVRPLGAWKEAIAIGVIVAGVRGLRAKGQRLDRLDLIGLAYVAIVAFYALAPRLFAVSAPTGASERFLAFRASAFLVLLLLAARHADLPESFARRALRLITAVGMVVAAIAVFEFFFSATWNDFVVNKVKYTTYELQVLDVKPFNFFDIRYYGQIGGQQIIRVGSVFLSPLTLGFYLLIPFAVAIDRVVRMGLRGVAASCVFLTGAALLLAQTRAALIGAVVIGLVAMRPAAGRSTQRRLQFGLLLAAAALVALPVAAATGLSGRVTTPVSGDEQTSVDHVQSFWKGVGTISEHPLGQGLATSAGAGQRFQTQSTVVAENNYLQVGIEVGVGAMALFIALTLVLLRRLRAAVEWTADLGGGAVRAMGVALAIGALFLQPWVDLPTAWTFWSLAGAMLGLAAARAADSEGSEGLRQASPHQSGVAGW